jgi:hypothetical protein
MTDRCERFILCSSLRSDGLASLTSRKVRTSMATMRRRRFDVAEHLSGSEDYLFHCAGQYALDRVQ